MRVTGTLDSTAQEFFDLDFYEEPQCSRFPQDFLEGGRWLGTTQVPTNGFGHGTFDYLIPSGHRHAGFSSHGHRDERRGRHLRVLAAHHLSASSPLTGVPAGSHFVMNGMQFDGAATVTVGGEPATGVNLINEHNLEANAPALPPGSINDIVVTNPSGLSGTLPNGYVSLFADVDPGSSFRDLHRKPRRQQAHGRLRRPELLSLESRDAPADGGLPPARQARRLLHAAALHRNRLRRRPVRRQFLRARGSRRSRATTSRAAAPARGTTSARRRRSTGSRWRSFC